MTMRFGVVGCGGAGADFADAVVDLPGGRIEAMYDPDPARLRAYSARVAGRPANAVAEVVEDPLVEAVYIATPHHELAPVAVSALEAGKHVLVEKPAALSIAELDALDAAARRAGRAVGVMYVLRQDPAVLAARSLVADGALGEVRQARIQTVIDKPDDYWVAWRADRATAGGGVLLMNSAHQLDLVRFITGLEYASVVAEVSPSEGVEHWAGVVYRMTGGAIVTLTASARSSGARLQERVELEGENGRLEFGGARDFVDVHLRSPHAALPAGKWTRIEVGRRSLYRSAVADFVEAVPRDRSPAASIAEARAALAAVTGAYAAAENGVRIALA